MKHLLALATATLMISTSQASTHQIGKERYGQHTASNPAVIQTAMKKGPVRVNVIKLTKPKLFVGSPRQLNADEWDYNFLDIDDVITSYRREDLQKVRAVPTKDDPQGEITEDIRWKLFLARQAALIVHKQKWG